MIPRKIGQKNHITGNLFRMEVFLWIIIIRAWL